MSVGFLWGRGGGVWMGVGFVGVRVAGFVKVLGLGIVLEGVGGGEGLLGEGIGFGFGGCVVGVAFGRVAGFEDVDLGAGDAGAVDTLDAEGRVEVEGGDCPVEDLRGYAGFEESAEKHVAGDAGEAIEIGEAHESFPC